MILKTKQKIALAAIAYRVLSTARFLFGKNDCVQVRRGGFRWQLDLGEGIDFAIYLLGAFESSTADILRKLVRRGDIVIDIGANIGAHTLGLAQSAGSAGQVYAIEPTDFAFAKLKQNLALNPELDARVHAHQILLAAERHAPRQLEIYASWPLKSATTVHSKHGGRLVTTQHAEVATLDDFVARSGIEHVDLIKIDVDGHEYPVLKGGSETLARFRPILVMEMSPYIHAEENHKFEELIGLLGQHGYSLQDTDQQSSVPLDADQLRRMIPDGSSINVIAHPT